MVSLTETFLTVSIVQGPYGNKADRIQMTKMLSEKQRKFLLSIYNSPNRGVDWYASSGSEN